MGVTVEPDEPPTGGETVRVTLRWQAIGGPWPDATVFIHLLDASGTLVAQHDGQPMGGAFPLSIWDDGDVILDVHEVTVPVDTAGPYRLAVGLYDPITGERYRLDDGGDHVQIALH